jgi:predicted nucleic acid-binding protein
MIDSRHIALMPLGAGDASRMRDLMRKYKDLPMDLADAALVCAAEKSRVTTIFTLDRKDFSVYRPHGGGSFSLLP